MIKNTPTAILIIAHAPLASALRECALHVFPTAADDILALDVLPATTPETSLAQAHAHLLTLGKRKTLLLTDLFGATPFNIAQMLLQEMSVRQDGRLITGVNHLW